VISRLGVAPVANALAGLPLTGGALKRAAGIASRRRVPAFAPQTFRDWFLARPRRDRGGRPPVILWPDTFNDHFHPGTLRAAADVLECLGFEVRIPRAHLCCGRPLYDFGMLDTATARLAAIMRALAAEIRAVVPIVGLEPSCVSVFRDELVNLFPASEQAHRLKQNVVTLAEFVDAHEDRLPRTRLDRHAVVHAHCHHKAVLGTGADVRVLDRIGVHADVLDAGCCGMAGAFGFEAAHFDVSMKIGERVLLPAVRAAAADTLVLADGFSCREQIAQGTDRRSLHLAEVLRLALRPAPSSAET
jgi:Fe-S oxidoreductase